MAKATQGKLYTVQPGDTIRNIERQAYGRYVNRVVDTNSALLKSRAVSDEGIPFIYPGDVLWIPEYANRYNNQPVTADFDTQVSIVMNGTKLHGAKSTRMGRAMNTIAAGFTFEVPFDPLDRDMVELLRPYTWYKCELFIGGELYITANAAKWSFPPDASANVAVIEARTMPGEMLECMGMRSRLSFASGLTLIDIGKEVVKPYGIRCFSANGTGGEVTADTEGGEKLGPIEQDETETDADFLQRVASSKGFLVTSMPSGDLLICRANVSDAAAVALVFGQSPVKSVGTDFDGSKRFSTWKGYTEESGVTSKPVVMQDKTVPRPRTFCFKATDAEEGSLTTAVKWRMAKSIAESLKIEVVVEGWRNANGDLWAENTKLTLLAPPRFIFTETAFITASVELTKDDSGGDQAALSLALPDSYTTTMPKQPFPWEGYYSEVGK